MASFDVLKKIVKWYYHTQLGTPEEKSIAYVSAFAPVELLRAMDIVCLYPENQAVVFASSGKAESYLRCSLKKKYSRNLCGYARTYLGSIGTHNPRSLPPPNFIVGSNNQCGTIHYWFDRMGKELNVPVFLLDYPSMEFKSHSIDSYVTEQHQSLVKFVTKLTGRTFDEDKLRETMKFSAVACEYWRKIHELGKQLPCRVKTTDLFDEMMPLVVARGTKLAAEYYRELYKEKRKAPPQDEGDFRFLWYGYPFWFLKNRLPDYIACNCVMATYATWWILDYGEHPNFRTLTQTYRNTYLNQSFEGRVKNLQKIIEEYTLDAVIVHINRSCKRDSNGLDKLKKILYKMNVPCLTFEADMMDEKVYAKNIVSDKIETFIEILKDG